MTTFYNCILNCFRTQKIKPEITEIDLFYNKVRLNSEQTFIIHNSLKEKSEKLKSGKIIK